MSGWTLAGSYTAPCGRTRGSRTPAGPSPRSYRPPESGFAWRSVACFSSRSCHNSSAQRPLKWRPNAVPLAKRSAPHSRAPPPSVTLHSPAAPSANPPAEPVFVNSCSTHDPRVCPTGGRFPLPRPILHTICAAMPKEPTSLSPTPDLPRQTLARALRVFGRSSADDARGSHCRSARGLSIGCRQFADRPRTARRSLARYLQISRSRSTDLQREDNRPTTGCSSISRPLMVRESQEFGQSSNCARQAGSRSPAGRRPLIGRPIAELWPAVGPSPDHAPQVSGAPTTDRRWVAHWSTKDFCNSGNMAGERAGGVGESPNGLEW